MFRRSALVRGRHLGSTIAAAMLTVAVAGQASEPAPFHLEYEAPPSCPTRAQFLAQLAARVGAVAEAPNGHPAATFRVHVNPDADGVQATVDTTLPDGSFSRRFLETKDCDEAIAAAAVVVTLVLPTQNEPAGPHDAEPTEAAYPPHAEPNDAPVPARTEPPPSRAEVNEPAFPFRFGLGGQLGVPATQLGSGLGGGAFLQATVFPDDWLAPSLRAAVLLHRGTFRTERGDAEIALTTVRLSACPLRIPAGSPFHVRPCALGELGVVRGEGSNTLDRRTSDVTWSAVGASARGAWNLVRAVSVEFEAAAVFPLLRDRFVFDPAPASVAFRVAGFHGSLLLGFSLEWP